MHTRLIEAPTKRQPVAAGPVAPAPPPSRLCVRFVSGRDPRIAALAAHCLDTLARGRLDVDVARGEGNRAPDALPSLVVVIHLAAEPAPLVADECGGRVDWHLECGALAENTVELMTRLRQHSTRLLADLGYPVPACAQRAATCLTGSGVPWTPMLLAAA